MTRKKRPSQVDIGGKTFQIRYTKMKAFGKTRVHERDIQIREDLVGAQLEDTLLHEIIHACLGVTGHDEMLKHKQEEGIVVALENTLSQLYRRDFR